MIDTRHNAPHPVTEAVPPLSETERGNAAIKLKVVTLTTELDHPGLLQLKRSLDYFGYDYHIIHQNVPSGSHVFGTQMPLVYDWAKNHSEGYTKMLYVDAWDSFFLGSPEEVMEKLGKTPPLFMASAEKACFPHPEMAKEYPVTPYAWKYLNAGGWFADIKIFCQMYEDSPAVGVNDQLWLATQFLKFRKQAFRGDIILDYECKIFQTIAFEHNGDRMVLPPYEHQAEYPNVPVPASARNGKYSSIVNLHTKQLPVVFHGNGRTNMEKVWACLAPSAPEGGTNTTTPG